jgi:hypothetical protein
MSFLGDWMRSKRARWQKDALAHLAERRKHERRAALAAKPDKAQAELVEMALLESEAGSAWGWGRLDPWRDLLARLLDFGSGGYSGGQVTSHLRANGADRPFFFSESQLGLYRDASRVMLKTNPNAQGLLGGVRRYTFGTGATVRCVSKKPGNEAAAARAQAVCDDFARRVRFSRKQREFFDRSHRDGDGFWQLFPQNGDLPAVRFVWPEQVKQPVGESAEEYGFGVLTDPEDAETPLGYAVHSAADDTLYVEVPAEEMVHNKLNTDSGVRRGLPDLYDESLDTLDLANDLARKMGIGSARQAAIAYIREHAGVKEAQIRAFNTADTTYTKPDPWGNADRNVKRDADGQVIDTNPNTQFKESPYNGAVAGHLEVFQMLLRRACARYNAPEWLGTSYSQEVNFASSLTAESPFVLAILEMQETYSEHFRDMFERVLAMAALANLEGVPADILDLVEVKVTLPNPKSRDLAEEATRAHQQIEDGYLSPQTAAEDFGLEWPKERKNIKEATAGGWVGPQQQAQMKAAAPPGQPGGTPGANGQPPGGRLGTPPPNGKPPAPANGKPKAPTYGATEGRDPKAPAGASPA